MTPDVQVAPRPCNRKGCGREATHWVCLKLRADTQSMPAEAFLGIAVCSYHRLALHVDDVVCDEGWEEIIRGFRALGTAIPRRELTVMLFRPLAKGGSPSG